MTKKKPVKKPKKHKIVTPESVVITPDTNPNNALGAVSEAYKAGYDVGYDQGKESGIIVGTVWGSVCTFIGTLVALHFLG